MQTIFNRYINYLEAERRASPYTLRNYKADLLDFFGFLRGEGHVTLAQANKDSLCSYLSKLSDIGTAKSSVARKLSAIRSFFRYLLRENVIRENPFINLESPRLDKRLPLFLTLEEIKKLVQSPDLSKPEGKRDRAWLELLYASGIRVSELAQLKIEQVNLDTHEIRVIGKGSKERVVLMGKPAVKAIHNYLVEARSDLLGNRKSDLLFLTRFGKPLTVRRIQKLLDAHAKSIGIAKRVHPHMVRHTFATHMLDGGADLRVVQELLGHADLSSTQIYTHVTKQQARKLYLKTHPLASESL